VVMPTGSGKSLIYQLAALQLPGLTLVASPLVALMKDQADSLARRAIAATFINSSLDPSEQSRRVRGLAEAAYKIVLVAPERFRSRAFRQALARVPISLLTVDEAHCLSQWGHDFRPDYLQLAQVRQDFRAPVTLALTATATPRVQDDILRLLGLTESARLVTGFNRPNLTFEAFPSYQADDKFKHLRRLLAESQGGAGIIYTGTRRDAEDVAAFIRRELKRPAEHYHGALDAAERTRVQEAFMSGALPLVVATNAFGMGIDRADVRFVVHYSLPGTLEAYYQEAGRAGRDGLPARAVLLYSSQDIRLQTFFIDNAAPAAAELRAVHNFIAAPAAAGGFRLEDLQTATGLNQIKARVALEQLETGGALALEAEASVFGERRATAQPLSEATLRALTRAAEQRRAHKRDQLARMVAYAEATTCRRRLLLDHFGDAGPSDAPACCDNCLAGAQGEHSQPDLAQPATTQAERAALIVLDTVAHLKWPVGRRRLAQVLKGSNARDMQPYTGARNLGKLSTLLAKDIEDLILQLLTGGYLKPEGGELPVLRLTPRGEAMLQARAAIPVHVRGLRLGVPPANGASAPRPRPTHDRSLGPTAQASGDLLAQGRTPEQIAAERGLTLGTVYGHLAQLIAAGSLAVDDVIPPEVQAQVRAAIEAEGSLEYLAPLKARLPESIEYHHIRCVVNAVARERGAGSAKPTPGSALQPGEVVEMGQRPAGDSVPKLIAALGDPNGNVRRLAASSLGKLRRREGVQPLLALLEHETGPQVRQYALKALGSIGDERARPLLERIAADPDEREYNRLAAQAALKSLRRRG
jgi:ATP-dependent DNA helicase RecQ